MPTKSLPNLSKKLNLTVSNTGYKINITKTLNAGPIKIKALIDESLKDFFEKESNKKLAI